MWFRFAAPAALLLFATPALAQHHDMPMTPPAPAQTQPRHDHAEETVTFHDALIYGVLGHYRMMRDASGTSWQPDVSAHGGMHAMGDGWMVMTHALLNGVYDWQDGPRGDEKGFVSGMLMAAAQRYVGEHGKLNLRAMVSPDPAMGRRGYPLLFAAGETADGATTLVDRQHPHDLFMELSASYAHSFNDNADSVFVYAGLPGEPAFGPPAFMHRQSAMDSPEAPISHHWLDSTHITYGVITAGYVHDNWKFEASRFRGREPDQDRTNIESGELDSTALRASWNPSPNWALQVSWADVTSPEQLHPDEDETRWSASALYTRRIGDNGWYSATAAYGRKERSDGVDLDAWLAEAAWHPNDAWTLFTRAERVETDELLTGPPRNVGRVSIGAIRDWRVSGHAVFGVGALAQHHFAPDALDQSYGGDENGAMGFVRLKID